MMKKECIEYGFPSTDFSTVAHIQHLHVSHVALVHQESHQSKTKTLGLINCVISGLFLKDQLGCSVHIYASNVDSLPIIV